MLEADRTRQHSAGLGQMDCIPIVKTSSLDPLYRGLPVVIVEGWRQVNVALLERWLDEYAPMTDPAYIQARLNPRAWLSPLRERRRSAADHA